MDVVATAGHVDHGKSTLVRALTGIEPDRWAEERRRGLTIDLGFAWTTLASGRDVAFVDVPGHQRFLGNMLAGLGPAPVVLFVVAADEGWQTQSSDHRDAVAALGIAHGLLVLTRADRATPERAAEVLTQARVELAGTGMAEAPAVLVSATTGDGLGDLRQALDEVLSQVPPALGTGRVRLWVDRAFTISGAGTVATATLAQGTVAVGDALQLLGEMSRPVTVRGLQSEGATRASIGPVSRVALNLRGVAAEEVRRGDALVTPGAWRVAGELDVRRTSGDPFTSARLTAHVGTAAIPARLRPFDDDHGRLTLDRALPVTVGDRLLLREPGRRIVGGCVVLDVDPPALRRRGDGARRAAALIGMSARGDARTEVERRGAVTRHDLELLGLDVAEPPPGVLVVGAWWVDDAACGRWATRLAEAVSRLHDDDALAAGLSRGAAVDLLGIDSALLDSVVARAGLESVGGFVRRPGGASGLGLAEGSVAELERRLGAAPFLAPEADDLDALRLGPRELAAAERVGRLLRLGDVVLLPTAPARAMRVLAGLEQPFTTSQARQALGTTRRVVIPLLEHLDARGWTRRLDAGHRQVVR